MKKCKPVNKKIIAQGRHYGTQSTLSTSVRGTNVALFISGDTWFHMNSKQAADLKKWLTEAITEIGRRQKHCNV